MIRQQIVEEPPQVPYFAPWEQKLVYQIAIRADLFLIPNAAKPHRVFIKPLFKCVVKIVDKLATQHCPKGE